MREITTKYEGTCARCEAALEVGTPVMYEKSMGIFCIGCEPTDPEEIRAFREAKGERKAAKYETWAKKREEKAQAQLNSCPNVRHDIAFNTQPGHIPFRERMNQADDRAYESLQKAKRMKEKAESLRHPRVKGDAERKREEKRERVRQWIKKGMMVQTGVYGQRRVQRVNKKTVTVEGNGAGDFGSGKQYALPSLKVDLAWIEPVAIKES